VTEPPDITVQPFSAADKPDTVFAELLDAVDEPEPTAVPAIQRVATDAGSRRRVVITGMGIISPIGNSVDAFWSALVAGQSGIDRITAFDADGFSCTVAGEVKDFDPKQYIDAKEARRMARFTQFAMAAATQAVRQAGLEVAAEDPDRMGVLLGNGCAGLPTIEDGVRTLVEKHGMRMSPFFMPMMLGNMAAGNVSLAWGLRGYSSTITTACAAATQAIGEAAELIRRGKVDVMFTGGAEAALSPAGLGGFAVMRALTNRNDDPQRASRPFDAQRDGFIPAEGAAILILESLEHALAREAIILAEVAGYGASADAYHIVQPDERGSGAVRAMRWALLDAGLEPADLDYINAHGTSTPLNDAAESRAIRTVFGDHAGKLAVSSTKSMTGHSLGAAGALEAVATVQTILTGTIHPTINYEYPDPDCDLDYVPNVARQGTINAALSNSFGFGGQNATLVLARFNP
jgi:3-oxoacyl-[acyl-carrier-protein] synthase II